MLGELSRRCKSIGISGVHGKTTTTMMVAAIVRELSLPGSVIAGGASTATDAPASVVQGDRFFVAETCEWRRHFLSFSPSVLVVTSVEADHLDYFKDGADVEDAFVEYAQRLPQSGEVLFCADDPGASRVARRVAETRGDIRLAPYGFSATGEGRLSDLRFSDGLVMFRAGETDLELHVPGEHNVLNAAAAAMVTHRLAAEFGGPSATRRDIEGAIRMALGRFTGSRRRSEVIGRKAGIIVLDDYAHHPTAIRATLEGFRQFYTGRRLIVDFMSHTYSRTRALAEQFGEALSVADVVILHDIYASARETNPGGIDGTILVGPTAAAAKRRGHPCEVHYEADVMSAVPFVRSIVKSGDLFVTMGAGDNWRIGRALLGQLGADEETEAVR
jgi:UDP-N-acetylmuramate--alanine ligase